MSILTSGNDPLTPNGLIFVGARNKNGTPVVGFEQAILNIDMSIIPPDPYDPSTIPENSIRVKFTHGYTPTMGDSQRYLSDDIWDITKNGDDWGSLFLNNVDVLEVLGAKSSTVTNM